VLGTISALVAIASISAMLVHTSHDTQHIGTPSVLGVYGAASVGFFVLGFGSLRARRWARVLTLVFSWYGLALGILLTVLTIYVLGAVLRTTPQRAGSPSIALTAVALTLMIVFMVIFIVGVPFAFVLFYSREDVKQTCELRDPVQRWTDGIALPVLGASLVYVVGAGYSLLSSFALPLFPFFGRYLTGPAASVALLLFSGLDAYIAVGMLRLRGTSWWVALISTPTRLVSAVITSALGNRSEAYSSLGWSVSRIQRLDANPIVRSHIVVWLGAALMAASFGYLLWIKRYFTRTTQAAS
jgi:hypothetical protein